MSTLRAKFQVQTVKHSSDHTGAVASEEIELSAVTGSSGDDVNKQWSKWTPSGRLTMTINNPDAMRRVLPGQEVYIDITVILKPAA